MSQSRTPPRVPQRPPFPAPRPGQLSPGAYALIRVCLGKDCPLPIHYRCPNCEWEAPCDPSAACAQGPRLLS